MNLTSHGYQVERLIHRGEASDLWLARPAVSPETPVAAKVLNSSATAEDAAVLRSEANHLARIAHPSVLPVLEVLAEGNDLALILPWMPGGSLRDLLDQRGTVDAGELVALLIPVAIALEELARNGLAHGDLKPANVLLDRHGQPVLADMGSVRNLTGDSQALRSTPAYFDPAADDLATSPLRSDVFSLGAIAYEALTGRQPHRGQANEVPALAAAGAHRPLAEWPAIDTKVALVVEAALSPQPSARPATAAEMVRQLLAVVDRQTVVLPGPAPVIDPASSRPIDQTLSREPRLLVAIDSRSAGPGLSRSTLVALAVAVLFVLISTLGPWDLTGRGESPTPTPTGSLVEFTPGPRGIKGGQ